MVRTSVMVLESWPSISFTKLKLFHDSKFSIPDSSFMVQNSCFTLCHISRFVSITITRHLLSMLFYSQACHYDLLSFAGVTWRQWDDFFGAIWDTNLRYCKQLQQIASGRHRSVAARGDGQRHVSRGRRGLSEAVTIQYSYGPNKQWRRFFSVFG